MKYDIIIAYRCYPWISKKPHFRSTNKLDMVKYGLKSMRACLWALKAKFIIIDDWCPDSFEDEIKTVLSWIDIEYIKVNKIGNYKTYKMQLDLLTQQNDAEIVYLAEDDYLYDSQWFEEWLELLKSWVADFVTLFDHQWFYEARHHAIKHKYHLTKNRVWRTVPGTPLTFMTTKKTLKETLSVLSLFGKRCWDYPMWLILTKYNILRFSDIDRKSRAWNIIPFDLISLMMTWRWWLRHILFRKKYKLFAPTPSIATHLESEDLAPLTDWDDIYRRLVK